MNTRNPGGVFRTFAIGDQVTVSDESSPHDGRKGQVTGASAGRISVLIGTTTYSFFSYQLVKG